MRKRLLTLTSIGAALTLFGAACGAKTTVTSGNTNISATTTINTSTTTGNSQSTGDFSTNTSVSAQTVTVTITAGGVSPKNLTVTSGTVVTFVNQDTISHHIASNPHPSHTDLPGFDNLNSATSYSFTFVKKGTFGYHDHADPFNTAYQGTITVQ